jgi:hypothetical protein|tara:strand:+ start:1575 stop:2294 length:720 start_codon:yes stop_codon:yes gene_type:complete
MKTVYWAAWDNKDMLDEMFLGYSNPVNVLHDLQSNINKENKMDNFLNCPAFSNQYKNTFMLKSPTTIDVTFKDNYIRNNLPEHIPFNQKSFIYKQPSLVGAKTIKAAANWIFFSEDNLVMETMHPSMHNTPVSEYGYYVPGGFNISQWFRPIEYAFQMWEGCEKFKVNHNDPMMYVRFNTTERIELKKFTLSPKLFDMSMSCVRLKTYVRQRNLQKLYDIFTESKMRSQILKEIKENLM